MDANGNCYTHKALARDPYVGNLTPMPGYALAGAAFLLLLLPLLESETDQDAAADAPAQ